MGREGSAPTLRSLGASGADDSFATLVQVVVLAGVLLEQGQGTEVGSLRLSTVLRVFGYSCEWPSRGSFGISLASSLSDLGRQASDESVGCDRWVAANRQVAAADVRMTLNQMRPSAELLQRALWERTAASDRRSEAVNDLLGGRVRLSDGQGNQYEAKAGSNYYFYDEQAGRTTGRPNDAVVGTNLHPIPAVDLGPLEVIR